jgi:hypothetical protein
MTMINLIALGLTLFAAFLLTTRTWRQKLKIEDVMGAYEKDLAALIARLNKDTASKTDKDIMELANILDSKIADDKDTIKDDIARAKTGIIVLIIASVFQSIALLYQANIIGSIHPYN